MSHPAAAAAAAAAILGRDDKPWSGCLPASAADLLLYLFRVKEEVESLIEPICILAHV